MSSPTDNQTFKKFCKDFIFGGISGGALVGLIQPLIYLKNRCQVKGPVQPLSIATLYKGGLGFAASLAPTIAIQNAATTAFSAYFNSMTAAAFGGAFSSIIVCPAELIMRQQQKHDGLSFFATCKMVKERGISTFARGFVPTMIRESVFSGAYQGLSPALKERFKAMGYGDKQSSLMAGVVSGVLAAVISHPIDTYKTLLQDDFEYKAKFKTVLLSKEAFNGLRWRIAMFVVATTFLPWFKSNLPK